ncbi:putative oxidoreductase, aryl-alcohol dehydrogenase like protein [Sphaerochaeta pleomorpha str. Grapes]|uniref:Putative oxidoreductase, aryl-alcohol dehydrogenase like protein n=1 Tax=Sphaerochaeta pleomorpha (strain ATCC BAA-1885 / DSM 22778 / Grapes) TaxID=158190 RepID=G8QS53_SPHPG|nr:aldo/keto reductase [Sphaerochaeta pleomorpha]AEV28914.1 putative oxidoreductase, aryl-alcohol dehydrogenase like protein [Sphaerochaeta pleomorpha str. Grapes]
MKYIPFFDRDLAQIALGCDHYGETISEEISFAQMDAYVEAGGNLLDTAHVYGQDKAGESSTSELVIGKWLKANGMRKELTVVSKGCHPFKDDLHRSRLNEKDMLEDIEKTLEQLGTDSVDIWYFHRDNLQLKASEILDMGSVLIKKGMVKHLGTSNWTTERIEEANTWAKAHDKPAFSISEIQWSLARCTPLTWGDDTLVCMTEKQQIWYEKNNFPVMCFASQAKGLFSKVIAGTENTLSKQARSRFLTEGNLALVPKCKALSEELGVTPAAICMAYLTSMKNPTIAIAGSSRLSQITDTLSGADLTLTEDQLRSLR